MKINCEITKAVVSALQQNDIDCYLVGGYVRDTLLNIEAVDIDIELHNTNLEQAYQIISNITPANVYGSFGVIALDAVNTEFALARTEVKTGDKHTNFDIQFITDGNLKLACLRRDFTINSMMYDLANDRLLDFYNGQSDLNHSILRHVSDKFSEDSLRVLRGVKFACRYNLKIADETEALCKSLAPDLKHLPTKRIENEMNAIFKGANDYSLKLLTDYIHLATECRYQRVCFGENPLLNRILFFKQFHAPQKVIQFCYETKKVKKDLLFIVEHYEQIVNYWQLTGDELALLLAGCTYVLDEITVINPQIIPVYNRYISLLKKYDGHYFQEQGITGRQIKIEQTKKIGESLNGLSNHN